jgi:hypothetical protein
VFALTAQDDHPDIVPKLVDIAEQQFELDVHFSVHGIGRWSCKLHVINSVIFELDA